ncbi:MAG: DUF5666 domain-containing protein, partial [Thermoanaerobaculia bacterium]
MNTAAKRCVIALMLVALPALAFAQRFDGAGRGQGPGQDPGRHNPGPVVTGTVHTVSGTTITILEGLVTIDATNAEVIVHGEAATIADVTPGARIAALLNDANDTGVLEAATIAIHDPPAGHLAGLVQAVDVTNKTFTILGLTIAVTDETSFGGGRGPGLGTTLAGLEDLEVNQPVAVGVDVAGGALTALRVHLVAATQRPGERMRGTVKTIETDSWVITDAGGVDVTFVVNIDTKIIGGPKVGDSVHVVYMIDSANAKVALAIVRSDLAMGPGQGQGPGNGQGPGQGGQPGPNHVAFDGSVVAISASTWTVGTTTVYVMPRTKITGNPQVGDAVHVEGAKRPDGSVTAF